jgi:penicillin-insensitive murein endopeptidase
MNLSNCNPSCYKNEKMRLIHMKKKIQIFHSKEFFGAVFAVFLIFTPKHIRAEPPTGHGNPNSLSVGAPMNGSLEEGEVLPKQGRGYVLIKKTQQRRARFGATELILLIKDTASKVNYQHPKSVLKVADLSKRRGGLIEHHGSHQNGRDVDLLFYLRTLDGARSDVQQFVPVDKNGYSTKPPMKYRLDVKENWTLVKALINSTKAIVQWIFVSDHIRKLLLDHAKKTNEPKVLINKAEQVLKQPGPKTHVDHFHVRIYCPPADKPTCRDLGPRWAWTR